MPVNPAWQLGMGAPDAGQMFRQGMEQGRADRLARETRNAMMAMAQNPNDRAPINALAEWAPEQAIQLGQQFDQRQTQARNAGMAGQAVQGDFEAFANLAQSDPELWGRVRPEVENITNAIGQMAMNAQTAEQWDAGVRALAERYPHLARYAGRFDLRQTAIAQAGQMNQWLESQRPRTMTVAEGGYVLAMDPDGTNAGYLVGGVPGAPTYVPAGQRGQSQQQPQTAQQTPEQVIEYARRAIQNGIPEEQVMARMRELGVSMPADNAGNTMTRTQASTILRSMNGNRQQFDAWVRQNNIRIVE